MTSRQFCVPHTVLSTFYLASDPSGHPVSSVVTVPQMGKLEVRWVQPVVLQAGAGARQVFSGFQLSTPRLNSGERSRKDSGGQHL